jgi:hypothetical protein
MQQRGAAHLRLTVLGAAIVSIPPGVVRPFTLPASSGVMPVAGAVIASDTA